MWILSFFSSFKYPFVQQSMNEWNWKSSKISGLMEKNTRTAWTIGLLFSGTFCISTFFVPHVSSWTSIFYSGRLWKEIIHQLKHPCCMILQNEITTLVFRISIYFNRIYMAHYFHWIYIISSNNGTTLKWTDAAQQLCLVSSIIT